MEIWVNGAKIETTVCLIFLLIKLKQKFYSRVNFWMTVEHVLILGLQME